MHIPSIHYNMVLSLAHERALLRMSKTRNEMNDHLKMEMLIAFDELREEHRWAWIDLEELKSAYERENGMNEKLTPKPAKTRKLNLG
jgi:hypothetical protein